MESVESQLDHFEEVLFGYIEFQLIVHTNRGLWEQTDVMPQDAIRALEHAVEYGFEQILERYKYSRQVSEILDYWRNLLNNMIWVATDVPYPHDYDRHMDAVITNCREIFWTQIRGRLAQAMIIAVSATQIIRRNWKEAWFNPSFSVCKRRLEREFCEMGLETTAPCNIE